MIRQSGDLANGLQASVLSVSDVDAALTAEGRSMPVELRVEEPSGGKKFIGVRLSGRLTREDYEHLVPELEAIMKKTGKIRLLVEMHDFHGWDPAALWEDVKFDVKHFDDLERIGMIGEAKWEEWMATFCKPFTSAEIGYFAQVQPARQ